MQSRMRGSMVAGEASGFQVLEVSHDPTMPAARGTFLEVLRFAMRRGVVREDENHRAEE